MLPHNPVAVAHQHNAAMEQVLRSYVATGSVALAAFRVGCSKETVYHYLKLPSFQAAIRYEIERALASDAIVARRLLRRVVLDRGEPTKLRIDAAKTLLDRAGYVSPKAAEAKLTTDTPSEMSSEDLRLFIDRAEQELGARAAPLDAPNTAGLDSQLIDLIQ